MLKIGLTGGIATGKSYVAQAFKDLGANFISADEISHEISKYPNKGFDIFVSLMGKDILLNKKSINRTAVRERVFADEHLRKSLEQQLHPIILEQIFIEINNFKGKYVLIEIPLLYECKIEDDMDIIIVAYCSRKTQLDRLTKRDNIGDSLANKMIDAQLEIESKKVRADYIIDTEQETILINKQIKELHNHFSH
jgi:dephospho-CoA kinase